MKQRDTTGFCGNAKAFAKLEEISVLDIGPLRIGQVENKEAATGMTVLISEEGMRAGLDVRGGGPASRDSQLLNPLADPCSRSVGRQCIRTGRGKRSHEVSGREGYRI